MAEIKSTIENRGKESVIRTGREALTTPPILGVIERLGLKSTLSRLYWRLLFRASGGKHTHTIGEVSTTFRASSADHYRHYHTLVDERSVLADLLSRLNPDDVFYDVGAYIGIYTSLTATQLSDGKVVSFEPRADCANQIEKTLSYNDVQAEVRREALSNEAGEAALSTNAQLSNTGTRQVTLERGDELVERGTIPAPTVVKIDVEGAEYKAIRGLKTMLSRPDCRLVYCEVHPTYLEQFDSSETEVREALERCGFSVETIHVRGKEHIIRGKKDSQ
jgi:FkbM family methyltransferase